MTADTLLSYNEAILGYSAAMGVCATAATDLYLLLLSRKLNLNIVNWALVGRWLGHLHTGRFIHRPIGNTAAVKHERILGWAFHYAIGVFYALSYLLLLPVFTEPEPGLISALVFGLVSTLAPWLILQPALGMGVFARHSTHPGRIRIINISVHLVFGLALYVTWVFAQKLAMTI